MDLEIRHLKLVEAIAKEGGMTKASVKLHLTQSALSHQLKDIESRLNTPLFIRLKKRMVLTEAGNKLLQSAQKVLQELESTEAGIRKLGKGEQGILRIATQCNTCYHWLPSILKSFREDFPGIDVQVIVEATHRPIEAVLDGKLDFAIAFSKVVDRNLSYRPLFKDELLVVMPPDHPLANRPYFRAQNFADETLIAYSTPLETNLVFQEVLLPAKIKPKAVYQVMLTEAIVEMVKAGLGIAVLARWAIAPYLQSRQLKGSRLTKNGMYREWQAVTLNRPQPAFYREFAKLVQKASIAAFNGKQIKIAS
jgi:LysR family transcriptional regulator, regulator for metE and metH